MKRPMMKAADRRLVLSSMVLAVLSVCAFLLLVWEPQQRELAEIALGQDGPAGNGELCPPTS